MHILCRLLHTWLSVWPFIIMISSCVVWLSWWAMIETYTTKNFLSPPTPAGGGTISHLWEKRNTQLNTQNWAPATYLHIFWFFSFSSILCILSDEKKKIYPKRKTAIYQFHHFADALAIFAGMMLPPSSPDFFRVSDVVERTLVGNFRSLDSHHPLLAWAITLGMSLTSLRVCSLS